MEKNAQLVDKTAQFGEDSVLRLMVRYSLPSILAMLAISAHSVINMTFIGRAVGPLGIAAIAVSGPITMVQGAINQFISNGCAAAISITLGQGDRDGAQRILGTSMLFLFIVSVINIIIGFTFMEQLLLAFGASQATLSLGKDYMSISLIGMVYGCVATMNPMVRIEGFPKLAMVTMLLMTGMNLILAPLFIFYFQWGIRGAALATIISQFAVAVWIMYFLLHKDRTVRLRLKYLRLKISTILLIMKLGLPTFLMQVTQSLLSIVMNRGLLTYGGDVAISAFGITNNINNLISQPVFGLNQGAQPIIGYNFGANKISRVKQALVYSLAGATMFSALGWVLTRLYAEPIFAFFNNDPELIAVGSRMLIVFRALIFVVGFQQAGAAYFQYSGKPMISIFLTLSRQVIFLIPLIVILPRFLQLDGILYSGPISDLISTILTGVFIIVELKRLNGLIRGSAGAGAD
ncbi:MAG: MATE family efflux transporter [Clostridiales bacterium]|nr:MATE family efflux transporter [Clostridiales bacterium]